MVLLDAIQVVLLDTIQFIAGHDPRVTSELYPNNSTHPKRTATACLISPIAPKTALVLPRTRLINVVFPPSEKQHFGGCFGHIDGTGNRP